jgi:hypothetical protein
MHTQMQRQGSWYDNLESMQQDDDRLQTIYRALRNDLSTEARRITQNIHVYPSVRAALYLRYRAVLI